jgi:hypothetical protein
MRAVTLPRTVVVMAMTQTDVAVLRCMEICAEAGWLPSADETLRLIHLREEYRAGRRGDTPIAERDPEEQHRRFHRLEWVRWMTERGTPSES